MNITYVTCFYDISRQADMTFYINHVNYLLSLPINIIFYTQEDYLPRFTYVPRESLKIVFDEEIPFFPVLDKIRSGMKNYVTNNPIKDTPEFAAVMLAKFDCLQRSMRDNPFNTNHFAWIDAGLQKVATDMDLLPTLIPSDKIRPMLMNYTSAEEILDDDFINSCKYKLAGGLFFGPKDKMIIFCDKVIATAMNFLDKDLFGLEQEFIAIVMTQNRDMFDPYYGDFSDLICNYYKPTNNLYLITRYQRSCINDEQNYNHVTEYLSRK